MGLAARQRAPQSPASFAEEPKRSQRQRQRQRRARVVRHNGPKERRMDSGLNRTNSLTCDEQVVLPACSGCCWLPVAVSRCVKWQQSVSPLSGGPVLHPVRLLLSLGGLFSAQRAWPRGAAAAHKEAPARFVVGCLGAGHPPLPLATGMICAPKMGD